MYRPFQQCLGYLLSHYTGVKYKIDKRALILDVTQYTQVTQRAR